MNSMYIIQTEKPSWAAKVKGEFYYRDRARQSTQDIDKATKFVEREEAEKVAKEHDGYKVIEY